MGFDLLCCQILSVTCDNASNNDTMIEELALLIDHFPGDANHTRCFLHIINLVAKSVLRQFKPPKSKVKEPLSDAAQALASLSEELESSTGDPNKEHGGDDVDGDHDDDDDDGLPDERAELSEEEIAELEEDIQPVRLVLAKVILFQTPTDSFVDYVLSFGKSPSLSRIQLLSSSPNGIRLLRNLGFLLV